MTINCGRCHDHKIDPLPQADYYRMLAFFRNVRPYGHRRLDENNLRFSYASAWDDFDDDGDLDVMNETTDEVNGVGYVAVVLQVDVLGVLDFVEGSRVALRPWLGAG